MAFTVQDDNGLVSGANAYADPDFVRGYLADRGTDLSATDDAALRSAIVRATQFIDTRYVFPGERRNRDQTTEHPRRDLYDRSGYLVTGIHLSVKQATAELAHRALSGPLMPDPERDATGRTVLASSQSVGPVKESVQYASGASYSPPEYPDVDRLLASAGILRSGITAVRA